MASPKRLEHQHTIMDIIAQLLASDPTVQRYLAQHYANQHKIVDAVLNDILKDIDTIIASPDSDTTVNKEI